MTWKTPNGERVLRPAEAALVAKAILALVDEVGFHLLGLPKGLTAGPFEQLSNDKQRFTVLTEVARHLLVPTPECAELDSLNESALNYIFAYLTCQFKDDLESAEEVWGQPVLNALRETGIAASLEKMDADYGGESRMPRMGQDESAGKWVDALEALTDHYLWDLDFELGEQFAQLPPAERFEKMAFMTIEPTYFDRTKVRAAKGAQERLAAFVSPFAK